MNKKLRFFAVASLAACVLSPLAASALSIEDLERQVQALLAQIAELKAQMTSPVTPPTPPGDGMRNYRICKVLYRNLNIGVAGDDVQSVQEFLQDQGYFNGDATGYYGPVTASAVAKWQSSEGLSSVGIVGPMSRERFKVWCGGGGGNDN